MSDMHGLLPWLESSWHQLSQYIQQNRIPQALMIVGSAGAGKQQIAEHFSRSLMCSSVLSNGVYCGECDSCRLFDSNTHPDYISIQAEEKGKDIGIAVIRELISKLTLKPQFDSYRVVIINPADGLNNASANAFLKYLEEPTERTCLVLITDKPSRLPATIKSRCQKLVLPEPDQTVAVEWLKQQGVVEQVDLLLRLSKQSPLLAKQFSESTLLTLRSDCFKGWINVAHCKADIVELAEQWYKLDKTELEILMFWLISWVIDIIRLAYQSELSVLYNQDLISDLQELAQRLDLKCLYKHYDFLLINQKQLATQLNKQLMFEEILIQWLQINSRQ